MQACVNPIACKTNISFSWLYGFPCQTVNGIFMYYVEGLSHKDNRLEHSDSNSSNDAHSDSTDPERSRAQPNPDGGISASRPSTKPVPPASDETSDGVQKGFFDTLDWQRVNERILADSSSDEELGNEAPFKAQDKFEDEFAEFSAQRGVTTSGKTEPPSGANRHFNREYEGIRIGSDQTEGNLFESEFPEVNGRVNADDLFGGSGWNAAPSDFVTSGVNLLDIGESEPSNLELLTGSQSDKDLLSGESMNPFLSEPVTIAPNEAQHHADKDHFGLFVSSSTSSIPNNSSSSLLFDAFDPFQSASPAAGIPTSKSSEEVSLPPRDQSRNAEDDFMAFLESKPQRGTSGGNEDLLGQWNMTNIASTAGAGMPRPASRTDLKSGMGSAQKGAGGVGAEGSGQKVDPFADLG